MISELCPHCGQEVKLINKFEKQYCPNCGKSIKPCSLCDNDIVNCNYCELDGKKIKANTYYKLVCNEIVKEG